MINFRELQESEQFLILDEMMVLLEENLPGNKENFSPFYMAIGEFLHGLILTRKSINPVIFGMILHDSVVCSYKNWKIPAAMHLGIACKILDPEYHFLLKFSRGDSKKVFDYTIGMLVDIRNTQASSSVLHDWKLWYLAYIAAYLSPYGNNKIPGLENCIHEMPNKDKFSELPKWFYTFKMTDKNKVQLERRESNGIRK